MATLIKRFALVLSLGSLALLQGCAGCTHACILGFGPGNPTFESMALSADRADPCQAGTTEERRKQLGRPEGYQRPGWCFAGRKYSQPVHVYDTQGRRIAVVK